jgi:hypothetical protein
LLAGNNGYCEAMKVMLDLRLSHREIWDVRRSLGFSSFALCENIVFPAGSSFGA